MLAEGVHQAAQGTPDRLAAHLDVQGDFNAPPDPAVVRTPNRGFALTCRVGLELDAAAAAAAGDPPRVKAQPALNAWLADALAAAGHHRLPRHLDYRRRRRAVADRDPRRPWPRPDRRPQPDFRRRRRRPLPSWTTGSADRSIAAADPRSDGQFIAIRYMEANPGQISVFAASALVRRLRGLALRSRPLRAGDVALPGQAQGSTPSPTSWRAPESPMSIDDLGGCARHPRHGNRDRRDPLLADPVANRAALLAGIDARLSLVVERLAEVCRFRRRRDRLGRPLRLADRAVHGANQARRRHSSTRWAKRLIACNEALHGGGGPARRRHTRGAGPPAARRRARGLDRARRRYSILSPFAPRSRANGPPSSPSATPSKRRPSMRRAPGLADRLARCTNVLPIAAFDPEPLDFTDIEDSVLAYWVDLQVLLVSAREDVDQRITTGSAALGTHDDALEPAGSPQGATGAADAIFGEGFALVPTFTLASRGRRRADPGPRCISPRATLLAHAARDPGRRQSARHLVLWCRARPAEGAPARGRDHAVGSAHIGARQRSPRCNCRTSPARPGWRSTFPKTRRPTASASPMSPLPGSGLRACRRALRAPPRRLGRDHPGHRGRRARPATHDRRRLPLRPAEPGATAGDAAAHARAMGRRLVLGGHPARRHRHLRAGPPARGRARRNSTTAPSRSSCRRPWPASRPAASRSRPIMPWSTWTSASLGTSSMVDVRIPTDMRLRVGGR